MILKRSGFIATILLYLMLSSVFMPTLRLSAAGEDEALFQAIEAANRRGSGSLSLLADIVLSEALPPITGSITIDGNGYAISGADAFQIFVVDNGELTIRNLTLSQARGEADGGAILLKQGADLVAENVTFFNNRARHGGAISTVDFRGSLRISDSVFRGNTAGTGGGAILLNGGSMEVSGSGFLKNEAIHWGGAIETLNGEANISNSTFNDNYGGAGGGIMVSGATTTMTHLTLMDNRSGGGDAINKRDGIAYLRNSLIGGEGGALDCTGGLDQSVGNFSQDGSCALRPGGDPLLGELTGAPGYYPLLDGSPAVDAADAEFCLETDQRGNARPLGGGCDIGAFESATASPPEATPEPELCTFVDAILAANLNQAVGACPPGTSHDIIYLVEDITLSEPLPLVNGTITVEGNGYTISGDDRFQIFVVAGQTLTLRNLTLTGGRSTEDGGAIMVQTSGELVVENVTFHNNSSAHGGGALASKGGDAKISVRSSVFHDNSAGTGGGAIIINGGAATITGSEFRDNEAAHHGGALEGLNGTVDVRNSTFHRNEAQTAAGILASGATMTMTHLTLVGNLAGGGEADGIFKRDGVARLRNSIVLGSGGAFNCTGGLDDSRGNFSADGSCSPLPGGDPLLAAVTGSPGYFPLLDGSPLVDAADPAVCLETDQVGNARPLGGGCDIGAFESATATPAEEVPASQQQVGCTLSDQILAANTNTAVGGCPAGTSHDIINLTEDITLSEPLPLIKGTITIEGNGHTISGDNRFPIFSIIGGKFTIRDLTLTAGNSAQDGGAILSQGAELIIENATFTDNKSEKGGGAISTLPSNISLTIRDSLFKGNTSDSGGGAVLVNGGAAVITGSAFVDNEAGRFGGGVEAFVGTVRISNSTFAGNQASRAGAILVSGATTTLTHLTLVDNLSYSGEGDAIHRRSGLVYLRNSIVAGDGNGLACTGGLDQSAGNFSEDGSCTLLPGGDPLLGGLTGSPGYFPLLDGSPAVDAADSQFCLESDQAGNARPLGEGCDIGAFESATAAPAAPRPEPMECTLSNQILAANTNTAVGGCPAGTSHDIITLTEDITLSEPLPHINGTITIEGNGHTISGDNQFRIFTVIGRKLTINNLTLTRGSAEGNGGAILVRNNAELVVNNSTFAKNEVKYLPLGDNSYTGGLGGAIGAHHSFNGRITIHNSVFRGNHAQTGGGAIYLNGGTMTISGSTFSFNIGQGFGGAVEISRGWANIENSTFQGNSSANGGGISITDGTVNMTHLTMLYNASSYAEGDAIRLWGGGGSAQLRNSVVAGSISNWKPDCHGVNASGGNFSQDGACGSLTGDDPLLGEMTGAPGYFPPLEGSPLVDAADSQFCLATDQAGKPRPIGGGCDIGAIEFGEASEAQLVASAAVESSSVCQVTTTHALNFRDGPAGNRIGLVPANATLTASARESNWFNVDYGGVSGWISGDYVTTAGICG